MSEDTTSLVRELYETRAEIKSLQERESEILSDLALEPGRFVEGPYLVDARPTVRFNPDLAKKVLTKAEFERILKPVPQSTIAKTLYPEKYSAMQKTSGVTVTIKVDDE